MAGRFFTSVLSRGNRVGSLRGIVAALVAVALVTASCSDDDEAETATEPAPDERSYDADTATEPAPDERSYDADTATEPAPDEALVDEGCHTNYPIRLEVVPESQAEVQYLDDVIVCTTPAQDVTLIENNSDAVWSIAASSEAVTQFTQDPMLFRQVALRVTSSPVLSPDSTVAVLAEPSSVRWTLEPGLSTMWLTHTALSDAAIEFAQNRLKRVRSWPGALATCSLGAYDQAGPFGQLLASNDPGEQVSLGIGIASSATACGKAIRVAQREASAAHVTESKATSFTDELSRGVDDVLRLADSHLSLLKQIGRQGLARVVASLP